MEYQKIINLLDNMTNQPSKCTTKNAQPMMNMERVTPIVKFNIKMLNLQL